MPHSRSPGACPHWVLEQQKYFKTGLAQQVSWSDNVVPACHRLDFAVEHVRCQCNFKGCKNLIWTFSRNSTQRAQVRTDPWVQVLIQPRFEVHVDMCLDVNPGKRRRAVKRMGKAPKKRPAEAVSGAAGGNAGQPNKYKKPRPMTPELQVRQWVQVSSCNPSAPSQRRLGCL